MKNVLGGFFNFVKSIVIDEKEDDSPSADSDVKASVQASILSKAADARAMTEAMRTAGSDGTATDSASAIDVEVVQTGILAKAEEARAMTQAMRSATVVSTSSTASIDTATDTSSISITEKAQELVQSSNYKANPSFDDIVQKVYPGAMTNSDLITKVTSKLQTKGYTTSNTLLATSLCCDELARQLEMDMAYIFGSNFNLGGLAGFPFAGNTGFGAMSAHIPDAGGCCLLVYGPHVGITSDGTVGKVERAGIRNVDSCCGSAIAASNYVQGITSGSMGVSLANVQSFTDFQQGAVQELILPHGKVLEDAANRMEQLPRSLYESQDLLMVEIVQKGSSGIKDGGLVMLGGIQINTGPATLDYFLPMRFDYLDADGVLVESMDFD